MISQVDTPARPDSDFIMRSLILLLAWITPAIIAGLLGWKGIWGTNSSFVEYLIPVPLAGGGLHIPSFVLAAAIIVSLKKLPEALAQWIPFVALVVFLAAQSFQLDVDRLNAWFFTDYDTSMSPVRFGGNPFFLFVATDALWVALYAWIAGYSKPWKYGLLLPLVPLAYIGYGVLMYQTSGPQFTLGGTTYGKARGDEIKMVYTPHTYDENLFRDWLESDSSVKKPWETPNAEHLAVLFTRSMQALKWGKANDVDNIVATFCIFEEDRSSIAHAGYYNCFADRLTMMERLEANLKVARTGFGKDMDIWISSAKICEGVEIPERLGDIAVINWCRGLKQDYPKLLERLTRQFGKDSKQVAWLRSNAYLIGMADSQ